jgi:hypothetical protein
MTKSLFIETILREQVVKGIKPMYSLTGVKGFVDVHEMFVQSNDPTGYTFSIAAFDSWAHFQHLSSNCQWFQKHLAMWQSELEVKMRSDAIRSLAVIADSDHRNASVTAMKYVAEKGWESKRGRPSKAEIAKERKQHQQIKDDLKEDASRLNLH